MKKALIIIDIQIMPFVWKDYGGKTLYNEQMLIDNTKLLIQKARASGSPIFYILYTEKGDSVRSEYKPLWQIHPEISPMEEDTIIKKYFADSFLKNNLLNELSKKNIKNLVFCGVQTEYCIDTTIKTAYSNGFTNELVSDAHSTYDSDLLTAKQIISHHNNILIQFANILPSKEIIF